MDGRIGRLQGRYRIVGARASSSGLASRLDRVMRGPLIRAYEDALDQAFRGDEAVYILRRVEAQTLLMVTDEATDAGLAQAWGERLAGAVVRAVINDADAGANLVRFDNQADYVAHFVVALLNGHAWGQWFYGAFDSLRTLDAPRALGRVLLDHREHLPSILAYVHRYGELDSLVTTLDRQTRRALWHDESPPAEADETVRPLFASALRLVDELGAWAGARPSEEELFRAYLRTAPPSADWRDRRTLTISLCDVLRFLYARGHLRLAGEVSDERFPALLDQTLEGFDWLDGEWLRASLLELLDRGGEGRTDLPVRPVGRAASPRQRELLEALAEAVREGGARLDASDVAACALRLLALLAARAPQWADDAAAKVMIQNLLTAVVALRQAHSPAKFMLRLRRGDVEGALRLLAEERRAPAEAACRFMAGLGEQALALAHQLAGEVRQDAPANGIESACAGLSLLLRTMLDVRLHALAEETSSLPREGALPRAAVLLLSLAERLCGEAAVTGGRIDEGLCMLAGLKERPTLDALQAHWLGASAMDHARFQAALLRIAAGQRLLRPAVVHLFLVRSEGCKTILVAGDESATVWPLGRAVETDAEIVATIIEWLDLWEEATGIRPALVLDESIAAGNILGKERGVTIEPEHEELRAVHGAGRDGLLAALEALGQWRPDVPPRDPTLALVSCVLLRMWARWLRRFSSSSVPYLLENFVRRRGHFYTDGDGLLIELERRSLDIIIEMSGYVEEITRVPWLGGGRVRFRLRGA